MSKPILHTAKSLEEPVNVAYDDALDAIIDGEIHDEIGLMRWGSNYTFLVTVEHNDISFMGVYKPRQGERPLWDFPDGTLCQRETASYVLSTMLGWDIVPPTVLREGSRGIGSVQVFIEHDPNRHYFTFDETLTEQAQRLAAFDVLANNADRKGGHCLVDADEHVWGIDHGLTFHPMNKLRTVIWDYAGQALSQNLLDDIQQLCHDLDDTENPNQQQLEGLLTGGEMRALKNRVNKLLMTGCYPMPGPGPNRPWPAV